MLATITLPNRTRPAQLATDIFQREGQTIGSATNKAAPSLLLHQMAQYDYDTWAHMKRVGSLTRDFVQTLPVTPTLATSIVLGAYFHDIGKLQTPLSILQKPGALNAEERECVQQHSIHGYNILGTTELPPEVQLVVLQHHEYWNGKGYPYRLSESNVFLGARIVSIVDVWDALTSKRSYRSALTNRQALKALASLGGSQLDPYLTNRFISFVQSFTSDE